ncbi:MAG: NUMOD3 domain-containing DNA-binding protein, partial [Nanoarchaeota archaeon]
RILSKEWKNKIKISSLKYPERHKYWLGKKLSEEHKNKIGMMSMGKRPMLGKKHSLKTLKLFSKQRKLLWQNPEWRAKMVKIVTKDISGYKNPSWKGGITPLAVRIRTSKEYHEWRGRIFQRDNRVCRLCGYTYEKGKKRRELNVDHIKSFSLILEENKIKTFEEALECKELWDINNGRTLCLPCHKKTYSYLNRWTQKRV